MFKNAYQSGLLSIFYSCGSNPLALWDMEVNNGHIKRITDNEVNSIVLEIVSTNVAMTYITCPPKNKNLGIKLPFLVMIVKNLKRYFTFEITILDDTNMRRRFRISNFQSTTKIKPFCTTMPIGLSGGWNQIQFNLSDFTRRAYGTQFVETLRVQVHANVRLRRIYFAERLYTEEELPQDYKLYLPLEKKVKKGAKKEDQSAAARALSDAVSEVPTVQTGINHELKSNSIEQRKSLSRKSTTPIDEGKENPSEVGDNSRKDEIEIQEVPLLGDEPPADVEVNPIVEPPADDDAQVEIEGQQDYTAEDRLIETEEISEPKE